MPVVCLSWAQPPGTETLSPKPPDLARAVQYLFPAFLNIQPGDSPPSLLHTHLHDRLSTPPSSCLGQLSFLPWTVRLLSLPNAKHAVDVVPDASLENRGLTALPLGHGTALQTIHHPKLLIQEMPNVRVEPVDQ